MNNIVLEAIQAVENGAKFHINFETKSLSINGKKIIKNGNWSGEIQFKLVDHKKFLDTVELLYLEYVNSIPSERSESKSRKYFYAPPEEELDDEVMLYGESRELTQFKLELYILCQIVLGFQWEDGMGKWFWQSKKHKELVLLKKWFNN